MADYRRFQPHRSNPPFNWRLLFLGVGAVVLVVLLSTWMFGRKSHSSANSNEPSIALVNDTVTSNGNANGNTNASLATNGNVNGSTNTNSAVEVSPTTASDQAILRSCSNAVSQVGEQPAVALTFDIVGDNDALTQLLTTLTAHKTPASFFVTGNFAKDHAAMLQRIKAAGYAVYTRGLTTSKKYGTLDAATISADLASADASIRAATGASTKPFFRPAQGSVSAASVAAAKAAGYCTILWTVDSNDWDNAQTAAGASTRVLDKAKAGSIILFGAGYDITPTAVATLITELPKHGLRFATLPELFPG